MLTQAGVVVGTGETPRPLTSKQQVAGGGGEYTRRGTHTPHHATTTQEHALDCIIYTLDQKDFYNNGEYNKLYCS